MFKLTREDLINYVKEIIEYISLIRIEMGMDFSKKITKFEINDFETVQKLTNFINMSYAYGERTASTNTDTFPIIKAKSTDGFDLELNTNVLTIKHKDTIGKYEIIQMYENSRRVVTSTRFPIYEHNKYIQILIVKCENPCCDITLNNSDDKEDEKRKCYYNNSKDTIIFK